MKAAPAVRTSILTLAVAVGALGAATSQSLAADYNQTNLVSDLSGLAAVTDPELKNPWGVSETTSSPFWISDQGTSAATLYSVSGSTSVSKIGVNPPSGFVAVPSGPTGQVSNSNTSSFLVGDGGNGSAAHFIFASLNGTISAWDAGTTAFVQATTPGASYSGLAVNSAQTMLYAANDSGTGGVNVFNSAFAPITVSGGFTDPNLPAGLVPFNVQDIGGEVYVTYAPAGHANQSAATAGMGAIDVFNENGVFQQRLVTGGPLAAPWGVALAPAGFGEFGGDLLVGNFSYADSEINAFNPVSGAFEGTIPIAIGDNEPGGLWDLTFGNGGAGGSVDTLYFTDGINSERDGLFAALTVPEPSNLALVLIGLIALGGQLRRRRA